jgi:hypothetical protein
MVHAKSHQSHKKDDEVDVWVINHNGDMIGEDFEHGETLGQRLKGKIRIEVHPLPKFDTTQ